MPINDTGHIWLALEWNFCTDLYGITLEKEGAGNLLKAEQRGFLTQL
jgi:hypothetical protein